MLCCSKRKDDKDDGLRPAGFIPIDANRWRTGEQKIPSRIENLNKEWLTVALRIKGHLKADGRVTSVEVRPIGEGLGMMADMALLHLTLEGALPGAPHRMVAKFAPQKQDKLPKFIVKFQLRNEAHFYNDFTVAGGGLPRPACYLAAERRRAKPTFLMLLEIVDDAVTYTRIGGCDVAEHLERAVGALGGLHARWWDHPRKAPLQWALHPHQGLGRFLFSRQYFAYSLSRALRAMRVWEPETFAPLLAWSELLTRAAPLVVKQCTTPPFTLVHGDAHLDNIFFADRFPSGCAFIDHANMMLAKPLLDVAFFLGTCRRLQAAIPRCNPTRVRGCNLGCNPTRSLCDGAGTNLHPDVRRAQEVALLRRYHATLVAGGVEGYSWEACWTDYRWAMLQCLFGYAWCVHCPALPSVDPPPEANSHAQHLHSTPLLRSAPPRGWRGGAR